MLNISDKELSLLNTEDGIKGLLLSNRIYIKKAIRYAKYEKRLDKLQEELLKLQKWVSLTGEKVVIIFEGRDVAGKGGAIRRIVEHLNPREYRVIALPKPNEVEKGQWYFQRYINQLPKKGEIVSGIHLLKMYFSISKKEQKKRFEEIKNSPLKKWKFSHVDSKAIALWDQYTFYKERMFEKTNTNDAPWKIIKANRKMNARIKALEYVLERIPYKIKDLEILKPINIDAIE